MLYLSDRDLDTLSKYIMIVEKVLPDDVCDEIIREFESKDLWFPAEVGEGKLDNAIRNVEIFNLSKSAEDNEKNKELDNKVYLGSQIALQTYKKNHPEVHIKEDTGYDILRYKEGQFYIQHTDSYSLHPRTISCSFALNDDYEGGEFAFFDRRIATKIKKGAAIIFPSNFMFPHEIIKVKKGTRYSIITWFR